MIIAITMLILWGILGIIGCLLDTRELQIENFPIIIFVAFIPFFPFIFHWCGLF